MVGFLENETGTSCSRRQRSMRGSFQLYARPRREAISTSRGYKRGRGEEGGGGGRRGRSGEEGGGDGGGGGGGRGTQGGRWFVIL